MRGRFAIFLFVALLLVTFRADAQTITSVEKGLTLVADVPMPGPPARFDYQSLDTSSGRLYIAHMNANQLIVFVTKTRKVVASLDGFNGVHGVFATQEVHRLSASMAGSHQVAAVDTQTLRIVIVGTAGPITCPDGLANASKQKEVFISDEHGGVDTVIS